ncbi:MAG: D-lyxose/D-mannose family sugar isomerase [Planctomycetota bacterium]|nr:D-lyxose/D-mannose family sugar isomerase [Planctomycetota bacterium]
MKRSEINALIRRAQRFLQQQRFLLPPFAEWTPAQWRRMGHEADEIREHRLGWDITDFGSGDFHKVGLLLFTLRNGKYGKKGKTYAEKVMIVEEDQVTPMHFHWSKTEDIINRGGGNLVIRLYGATPAEKLAKGTVQVKCDGVLRRLPAGGKVVLRPGESITLEPRVYHEFYGERGRGTVLVGEVSSVNDDERDNRFLQPVGRFPKIEEDEPPYRLLCNEYPPAPGRKR